MRNHSYENEFHLHVHFHANQTHFHLNGFARGLVLKMRQRATRKWPTSHPRVVVTFLSVSHYETRSYDGEIQGGMNFPLPVPFTPSSRPFLGGSRPVMVYKAYLNCKLLVNI